MDTADLADLTLKRYDLLRGTNAVTEQDISEREQAVKAAHAMVLADEAAVVAAALSGGEYRRAPTIDSRRKSW